MVARQTRSKTRSQASPSPPDAGSSTQRLPTLQRSEATRPFWTLAYEVNSRYVEMLAHCARTAFVPEELTAELRPLWASLNPSMRSRLAQRPYLLADMRFRDEPWWLAARQARKSRPSASGDPFKRVAAIKLARSILILVWNGLRLDPAVASVLYGVSAPVSRIIIKFTLDDVEEIARRHCRQVRPRWEDRPAVWRELILAAQLEKPMRACNLHALQLLTGDLIDSASVGEAKSKRSRRKTNDEGTAQQ